MDSGEINYGDVCSNIYFNKKTYVFKNVMDCKYKYDFTDNNRDIVATTDEFLHAFVNREPSLTTGPLIRFALSYVLFADQPLLTTFSNPTLSEPGYIKYGSPVPGEFDIGQWFRPYTMEMQMWKQKGTFELLHEPMGQIEIMPKRMNQESMIRSGLRS